MAFILNNLNNDSAGQADAPKSWGYKSATDSIATIETSGYFNAAAQQLNVGDIIYLLDSTNQVDQCTVTVCTKHTATVAALVTVATYVYDAAVDTNGIADGAVTKAKLNADVAGGGLTGGAGSALAVVVDNSTIEINANALRLKALGVTAAKLAVGIPRTVTVALTSANLHAAYAAPIALVAAGGANTLLIVENVVYEYNFVSVQETGGGAFAVQYDSTVHGAGTLASATTAAATLTGFAADSTVGAAGALASGNSSTTVNKGLYFSNATAAFATGDGTLNIHVTYSTVTTAV